MTEHAKSPTTTLDYLEDLVVPGNVFTQPSNEYWALLCLKEGMVFLSKQVAACEDIIRRRINPGGGLRVFSAGNLP